MRFSKTFSIALVAILLAGCVTQGNQKEFAGGLLGAGLGGLAGSKVGSGKGQLVAVAVGTLAGAFIGKEIGSSLDKVDSLYAERAQQRASLAPIGQTIAWSSPDSGHSGTVLPVRQGTHVETGAYCREYQTTVNVNGQQQTAYGTSCRKPDGSWEIVN